ncbi:expressed unknown protein [Seminavis robusta]|uniref:Uncharacterized protein n=1 Tax=Seminavis robusta TaxID=568900 RepID=A0A9N8ECM5_9STRA|nr:expressed unknown protein [Seminavis robusta]|eukprot:Sro804_g204890.1 n/a (751) ;mRNA; r:17162-19646
MKRFDCQWNGQEGSVSITDDALIIYPSVDGSTAERWSEDDGELTGNGYVDGNVLYEDESDSDDDCVTLEGVATTGTMSVTWKWWTVTKVVHVKKTRLVISFRKPEQTMELRFRTLLGQEEATSLMLRALNMDKQRRTVSTNRSFSAKVKEGLQEEAPREESTRDKGQPVEDNKLVEDKFDDEDVSQVSGSLTGKTNYLGNGKVVEEQEIHCKNSPNTVTTTNNDAKIMALMEERIRLLEEQTHKDERITELMTRIEKLEHNTKDLDDTSMEGHSPSLIKRLGQCLVQHVRTISNVVFTWKTALLVVLVTLICQILFLMIYTSLTRNDCMTVISMIDEDWSVEHITNQYDPSNGQFICSTSTINMQTYLTTNEKYQQFFSQEHGHSDTIVDLSRFGYDFAAPGWKGIPTQLPFGPIFDPNNIAQDQTGHWHRFSQDALWNDEYYYYSGACAEACATVVADFGFHAYNPKEHTYDCWCGYDDNNNNSNNQNVTSRVCLANYNTSIHKYHDCTVPLVPGTDRPSVEDFMAQQIYNDDYLDSELDRKFFHSTNSTEYFLWNDTFFRSAPIVVFSKRHLSLFDDCNESELKDLCQFPGDLDATNSSNRNVPTGEPMIDTDERTWGDDTFLGDRYAAGKWVPCSLWPLSCEDYNKNADVCGGQDQIRCGLTAEQQSETQHQHEIWCDGLLSIHYVTCPGLLVALGASMGYLVYVEAAVVGTIAVIYTCVKKRKENHETVVTTAAVGGSFWDALLRG